VASRLILVGQVAGAFGVKGEVRITAYTEDAKSLLAYGPLLREDGSPALTLTAGRPAKGSLIARAAEVESREAAQGLRGLRLYVPRDALPPAEDECFYITDLIGLAALSPQGESLGRIKGVNDFGAGDLLEIEPPDGGATWWSPFTRAAVPQVRLEEGVVVVVRSAEVE
jgi:16S rRNA processing protein RimM